MELRELPRLVGRSCCTKRQKTSRSIDDRTIRFEFNEPFLDFPILLGTGNLCGAGWVVPRKYYQQVGKDGFLQKPIGAGPYKLVSQEPGTKLVFEAFEDYYRPVHVKRFEMIGVPEAATRMAMLEREEADIIYLIEGQLIAACQAELENHAGAGAVRLLVARIPRLSQRPEQPVPRQAGAPGGQPRDRPQGDQRRRKRRDGQGQRQLDQQRCRIRARLAGVRVQRRQGQGADDGGRPPERVQGRLADRRAELFLARRARHLATEGDRHPTRGCRRWSAASI